MVHSSIKKLHYWLCDGVPHLSTPTQCAIPPPSVSVYQQKLRSKRAYHALH